jgi:cytochrome c553
MLCLLLAACGGAPAAPANLPPGDAASGEALFTQAINGSPPCSSCHAVDETVLVGPGFAGYGAVAGTRVAGLSVEAYTAQSITQPAAHLVTGFANVMYSNYGQKLDVQQVADLTAFLLTH